jgi:hypothetical protein
MNHHTVKPDGDFRCISTVIFSLCTTLWWVISLMSWSIYSKEKVPLYVLYGWQGGYKLGLDAVEKFSSRSSHWIRLMRHLAAI